jgi:hypothetical protein
LRQRRASEAAATKYAPAAAGRAPLPGSKRWLTFKVVDVRALSGTRFQAKIRWAGTSEDGSEDTWEPLTKGKAASDATSRKIPTVACPEGEAGMVHVSS